MIGKLLSLFARAPDFCIGSWENPYLLRWYIIPKNRYFNIYLHKFLRDDDDRALHDHPWPSCSILLKGSYIEIVPLCPRLYPDDHRTVKKVRRPGSIIFRRAYYAHRIELFKKYRPFIPRWDMSFVDTQAVWSLFITGPKVREWGFHCPKGWRHWKDFCAADDSGQVGRGCE